MKSLLAAIALVVLVGSALAVPTAGAGAEWTIEGESLSEVEPKGETVSISGGPLSLSSTFGKLKLLIKCEKVEGSGTIFTGGTDQLTIKPTSCKVVEPATCKLKSESITIKSKSAPTLTGSLYEKLEAQKEGEALATIGLEGELCAFPEAGKLTGSVATESAIEELVKMPFKASESISSLANEELKSEGKSTLSLKFGESAAILSGEFSLALSGGQAGRQAMASGEGQLCKIAIVVCPAGSTWTAGMTTLKLESTTTITFTYGARSTTCKESKFIGPTDASAVIKGTYTNRSYDDCKNPGGTTCPVVVTSSTVKFRMVPLRLPRNKGLGVYKIPAIEVLIECESKKCFYTIDTDHILLHSSVAAPETFASGVGFNMKLAALSDASCNGTGTMKGTLAGGGVSYKFTQPSPLFVAFWP
jgi:hypothetical protein